MKPAGNADVLRSANEVLVISGAGISAESGIPTFRGPAGYWRHFDPVKLATHKSFTEDPKTVWEWYNYRRVLIASSEPNSAHVALATLEKLGKRVVIITQNVDDLHERAGSTEVIHIHGSIWHVTCLAQGTTYENREVPLSEIPPKCECGSLLRPAVVWFDEELPADALASIDRYFQQSTPDVVLVIGTEATFDYIRGFVEQAKGSGAFVVEVNPTPTVITPVADLVLATQATTALELLMRQNA
jgi:NAD-dependent deacetylase